MRARHLDSLRVGFAVAIGAVILAACGSASQASLPATGASAAILTASATAAPTASATPAATPAPTLKPVVTFAPKATVQPTQKPPPPPPAFNYCGAPANPWHYNFCGGSVITAVPSSFCSYFPCIPSFWKSTNGYAEECVDGKYSHSGGRAGACSYHDGELRPVLAS